MNPANRVLSLSLLATLLIAGCAGTNFIRPDPGAFTVGKSTLNDVAQKMGNPRETAEAIKNEKQIKIARYVYAEGIGEGVQPGVTPARGMTFAFYEGTLISEEFVSSFKTDSTDFDDTRLPTIVKGKTKKDDVIGLLGRPTGQAMYPLIKNKDDKAVIYTYVQAKGTVFNMQFYRKVLIVSYNEQGIVTDVDYTVSGNK